MKKYYIKLILYIFLLSSVAVFPKAVSAKIRYPINTLGNCQNARECYLFCEIPRNFPACWSYNRFVINSSVLGGTDTNLIYPIPQLANCKNATECFNYCEKAENQASCTQYGIQKGLVTVKETPANPLLSTKNLQKAKKELGCDSQETCFTMCNLPENYEKCSSFSQKYGTAGSNNKNSKNISTSTLSKAKKTLGCKSLTDCIAFCDKTENHDVCFEFAQSNSLLTAEQKTQLDKNTQAQKEQLELAKTELGCNTVAKCSDFCELVENYDKCLAFTQKLNSQASTIILSITPSIKAGDQQAKKNSHIPLLSNKTATNSTTTPPCKNDAECLEYCRLHPEDCPSFPTSSPSATPIPTTSSIFRKAPPSPTPTPNFLTTPQPTQ